MGPKKLSASDSSEKKKRKGLSMETKREIIDKYEQGVKLSDIAREYGRNPSTIGTILKQKEVIKAAKPSMGTTVMSKRRTPIHDEMERLLLVWIKDKGRTGDTLTEMIICEKASSIYNDLVSKAASDEQPTASTSSQEGPPTPPEFRASHGWFDRFKKRTGIHSVVRHGEAESSDQEAAEEFLKKFEELINQEGYIPQQIFNCDETGLFWKKMPRRTYITVEEKKMPGHKPMKDRLTLALCANASGDSKVKPLLVCHSENLRAFKQHKILKERLEVMWRSNPTAWVTRQFFVEWVNLVFAPAVKKFLEENDLPMNCLLIIDNAPAHPSGLEDDILEEFSFIKVLFLPPNTTPLLQPMDQQVISNFKKLYTKHMFKRCSDITESAQLTLREFWKNHFDIVAYLKLISLAWREVSRRTLNSAWRKLWPDAVAPRDFEDFEEGEEEEEEGEPQPEVEVEEIVNLGTALGLEVDEEDINDLVHEHQEELSMAELQELEAMQHSSVQQQFSEEEEEEAVIPSRTFSAIFRGWPILLIKITLKRTLPFVL
ncbi:tigger transposable element-derived protein 1-like [Oreochromis aureus]|uniref:tigger transposable element-derived protein 1-like n=1 Tax=Oreochromis aureus TaxID=47969 RepID=UPI00195404DE|nr:tigger transposable element-derived protein 1-like [Oreochromis aureus]